MGTLNVYFEDGQGTRSTVFTKTGNQGDEWFSESMVSPATDGLKVRQDGMSLFGRRGKSFRNFNFCFLASMIIYLIQHFFLISKQLMISEHYLHIFLPFLYGIGFFSNTQMYMYLVNYLVKTEKINP